MRIVIRGIVHRDFRSASNLEHFDKAIETNRAQWLSNQYPESWSANVVADALCKIIEGKGMPLGSERSSLNLSPKDMKTSFLMR